MKANSEKKLQLEAQAEAYQQEIQDELADIKQVAKERGTQILVAGGLLAGAYLLYSAFSGNSKKKESSVLGTAIKSYAVALILSYAKDQLVDYLQQLESESEQSDKNVLKTD